MERRKQNHLCPQRPCLFVYRVRDKQQQTIQRQLQQDFKTRDRVTRERSCHCLSAPNKVKVRNTVPSTLELPKGILNSNLDNYAQELLEGHYKALMKDPREK